MPNPYKIGLKAEFRFRLHAHERDVIERMAAAEGEAPSVILRRALREYVSRHMEDNPREDEKRRPR